MPHVAVSMAEKLSKEQILDFKATLGQLIAILPTKSESVLMVDIADDRNLFFAGEELAHGALVDVRLYGESPFEAKQQFTKELTAYLEKTYSVPPQFVYVNFVELPQWGVRGGLI